MEMNIKLKEAINGIQTRKAETIHKMKVNFLKISNNVKPLDLPPNE